MEVACRRPHEEDYTYASSQLLAAETDTPARTLHFFPDHLGTARLITANGGTKVAFHTYYPFGDEATASSQDTEKLKFTGHERDAANLDYMHARYYAPKWGRFLSVDPVLDVEKAMREPQQWNRYSYVTNNPLKYTDPNGRDKKIYILQSFAMDSTYWTWGGIESQATNGYEVDPNRISSAGTYEDYLAKADNTDFVFTFSHAAASGITDAAFFSLDKNKVFDVNPVSTQKLADAINRDSSRPAGVALIGCNTLRQAQQLANKTGISVVGSVGLVSFANDRKAIGVLTAYASKNGRIDQKAIDQVNKAICPSGKCNYRYELAMPK